MTRMTPLVFALAAAALLSGCESSNKTGEAATSQPVAGSSSHAAPADMAASDNGGVANEGDALLDANDRAIAENKRMIAMLGRYQAENFEKYEQLRKDCETKMQGTLADSAAPAVARCIQAGW
jgi:hypothetical protein